MLAVPRTTGIYPRKILRVSITNEMIYEFGDQVGRHSVPLCSILPLVVRFRLCVLTRNINAFLVGPFLLATMQRVPSLSTRHALKKCLKQCVTILTYVISNVIERDLINQVSSIKYGLNDVLLPSKKDLTGKIEIV